MPFTVEGRTFATCEALLAEVAQVFDRAMDQGQFLEPGDARLFRSVVEQIPPPYDERERELLRRLNAWA